MNVSSKSINASDLDAVYEYFDDVVNKLIRTEVNTEEFPVLTDFVADLADLVDRLDELIEDVNPRVEDYLTNKKNEEELRNQMEMMQQQLAELQKERRERFGSDGGDSSKDEETDIYDWPDASSDTDSGSAVIESPGFIDFTTDIEDMIGDIETDISFSDEEEEEKIRQEEEERKRIEEEAADELLREALDNIDPLDALGGALEMQRLGDYYKELEPEDGLYDDYEEDDEDDDEEDMFAGTYGQNYGDFRYEDDDDEPDTRPSATGSEEDIGSTNYFDDDDDSDESLPGGYDDSYDDGYDDPGYDDDYDDAPRGRRDDDLEDDAWDDSADPLQGRNIDQLLSSASMTI